MEIPPNCADGHTQSQDGGDGSSDIEKTNARSGQQVNVCMGGHYECVVLLIAEVFL